MSRHLRCCTMSTKSLRFNHIISTPGRAGYSWVQLINLFRSKASRSISECQICLFDKVDWIASTRTHKIYSGRGPAAIKPFLGSSKMLERLRSNEYPNLLHGVVRHMVEWLSNCDYITSSRTEGIFPGYQAQFSVLAFGTKKKNPENEV